MNVVIYARYSCERQTEQSIEGQLRECKEFAEKHDMTIVDTYIDRAISGTSTNHREAFLKMIADSEKHAFEGVLMYKMDRFARNRYDSAVYKAKLKKNGVRVYYAKEQIPEGPEGIILESLLEGMAEYYSAELSQKIKRGMRENALKGKATGGSTAIGYKITPDKTFAIDEDYADVVRHIFRSYARGERVEDICRDLNEKGIRTPRGCLFNPSSMRKMLQNEKYIGVYVCKDIRLEDAIPPIIDKSLFHEVQQILARNRKAPARAKAKVDYLLSGKAYCGKCGNGLVGESSNPNSDSGPHYYYKCANRKKGLGCDKKTIRKEELENLVAQKVAEVVLRPEKIKEIAQRCEEMQRDMVRTIRNPEADMLKKQLEKTKKSIANIMMAMEQGIFTKSTKEHLEALEQRKETLEIEIQRTSMVEKVDIITADQIEFMLLQFLPEANTDVTAYADDIISCFVHSVYLWDDSCAIWLNLSNQQPKPHKNRCAKVTPESTQRLQLSVDLLSGNVKKNLVQKNVGENSHLETSTPANGSKILLERIPFIWNKMSFTHKVTARNIFCYKKRMLMTIFGVCGSVTILFAGLSVQHSISGINDRQFGTIIQYDLIAAENDHLDAEEQQKIDEKLSDETIIKQYAPIYYEEYSVIAGKSKDSQTIKLICPENTDTFSDYIALDDRKTKELISLSDDGVVISKRLGKLLDVSVGDTMILKDSSGQSREMKIAAIAEMYTGHFVFISPSYYETISSQKFSTNADLIQLCDRSSDNANEIASEFMRLDGIAGIVQNTTMIHQINIIVESLNKIMWVLIAVAVLLGVVILYNLTNINVSERIRELSTINVLGFFDKEVTLYIYRGTIILTLIGILVGFLTGDWLYQYIITVVPPDEVMFNPSLSVRAFAVPFLLISIITLVLGFIINRRLRNVDMLDALKSVD